MLKNLEDSIIFSVFERSRYGFDHLRYQDGNFLEFIRCFENMIANMNGYNYIEDCPFLLNKDGNNINNILLKEYVTTLLPDICQGEEDNLLYIYEKDFHILRLISRRIHYGIYVAMAKYESDPKGYGNLIDKRNSAGIMTLLTDVKTEELVMDRVKQKALHYSKAIDFNWKRAPDEFFQWLYKDLIIPLTKEVEVEYLLNLEV